MITEGTKDFVFTLHNRFDNISSIFYTVPKGNTTLATFVVIPMDRYFLNVKEGRVLLVREREWWESWILAVLMILIAYISGEIIV